jgi:predicted transcriptional regulator
VNCDNIVHKTPRALTEQRPEKEMKMAGEQDEMLLTLTADIVSAHVENNEVSAAELPDLIAKVHSALAGLGKPVEAPVTEQQPAVSVRSSVKPDYIVCLEDGKKLKMLKRYLRTNFGMSPDEYRTKWKLPADYPMVAPNYADARRNLAHKIGLGRKKDAPAAAAKPARAPKAAKPAEPKAAPKPRGRKPKVATAEA